MVDEQNHQQKIEHSTPEMGYKIAKKAFSKRSRFDRNLSVQVGKEYAPYPREYGSSRNGQPEEPSPKEIDFKVQAESCHHPKEMGEKQRIEKPVLVFEFPRFIHPSTAPSGIFQA
jgi:hypothetical protein